MNKGPEHEIAQIHSHSYMGDMPKSEYVKQWEKQYPDRTIESADSYGGSVLIRYWKNDQLQQAREKIAEEKRLDQENPNRKRVAKLIGGQAVFE